MGFGGVDGNISWYNAADSAPFFPRPSSEWRGQRDDGRVWVSAIETFARGRVVVKVIDSSLLTGTLFSGGHATVTPVGLNHTSGVPNPGDLGKNTWSSIPKGWAHFPVKKTCI